MNFYRKNKKRVGIFTSPIEKSGITPLFKLVDLIKFRNRIIYLITGNSALDYFSRDSGIILDGVRHTIGKNVLLRIVKYISTQLILSLKILKYSKKVDIWFSIFGSQLLLPTICAKLTKKKILQITAGSSSQSLKFQNDRFSPIIKIISTLTNIFSDYIIVYSSSLISEWGLERFKKKIITIPINKFIDINNFFMIKSISERDNIIGYVGRLSEEKGVLNFLEAIRNLSKYKEFRYIIIGEGSMKNKIIQSRDKVENEGRIQLLNWVPYKNLNNYLNEMKLLVIPSYTEGFPNIMLEAMASGTPVLASKVGSIADILIDGKTGFFLENNNPKTISEKITEIMKRDDLSRISTNSIRYIENNFTFRNAQKRYHAINYIARR